MFHTYGTRIENRYVVISYGVALSTRFLWKSLVEHIYARELELYLISLLSRWDLTSSQNERTWRLSFLMKVP